MSSEIRLHSLLTNPDLGARSLISAVENMVEDPVVESYLEVEGVEGEMKETNEMMEFFLWM